MIYKNLLQHLKNQDKSEILYKKIHKGTPFFWIGFYSFIDGNYNQAIFYLDAALAEDKLNHPPNVWPNSGAAMFFLLKSDKYQDDLSPENYEIPKLWDLFLNDLNRFNTINKSKWTIDDFRDKFVYKIIDRNNTAMITTLYSFVLEKDDIVEMINLRGINGGTTEPMLIHLFKGALIFETLLKYVHPKCKDIKGLGNILQKLAPNYVQIFPKCEPIETFEKIIQFIKTNESPKETAFCITYKIRNKSAHDLNWKNEFTIKNYQNIYQEIINAIFYVLEKNYLIK